MNLLNLSCRTGPHAGPDLDIPAERGPDGRDAAAAEPRSVSAGWSAAPATRARHRPARSGQHAMIGPPDVAALLYATVRRRNCIVGGQAGINALGATSTHGPPLHGVGWGLGTAASEPRGPVAPQLRRSNGRTAAPAAAVPAVIHRRDQHALDLTTQTTEDNPTPAAQSADA